MQASAETPTTYDLQMSCVHEAAHLVAASHFGATGIAKVSPVESPTSDQRHWVGSFTLIKHPRARSAYVVIALAGIAAETIASCLADDPTWDASEEHPDLLQDAIDIGELSESDAAMAGDFTYRDLQRTWKLVWQHWGEIEASAMELRNSYPGKA